MMRKKLLFIAACAALVLIFAGFTGLGMYNRQQEQKLANAKKSVQQVVQTYDFNAQKSGDIMLSLGSLSKQIFDKTVHTTAPGQSEFMRKSTEIQLAITHMTQFAEYSKKVGVLLADKQLGGKFVSSDDAMAQAKKWQDFNEALKKIAEPVSVRKQHDVLVASTANQVAIATKASDAYKANDATTIEAQTKAANDELTKIQSVYDDVYALVRAQQSQIISVSKTL